MVLLGVALTKTTSIPIGSIKKIRMFPLNFEEFLIANSFNEYSINSLNEKIRHLESLDEIPHNKMIDLFCKSLIVGGFPDIVNLYLETHNIQKIREAQPEIHEYYIDDTSKYDNEHKLKIKCIYELIPSNLKKRKSA